MSINEDERRFFHSPGTSEKVDTETENCTINTHSSGWALWMTPYTRTHAYTGTHIHTRT